MLDFIGELRTLDIVLILVVIVYGTYLLIQNIRLFLQSVNSRKEYLQTHKNYEEVNQFTLMALIFIAIFVLGIIGAVIVKSETTTKTIYNKMAFLVISELAFGMLLSSIVVRRALFDTDGFQYEKEYYRFRSIRMIQAKGSINKRKEIYLNSGEKITVTNAMGKVIEEKLEVWKNRKKNKNK